MVTRVDKKPIIYNTCLLRCIKPAIIASSKATVDKILKLAVGHRIPSLSARQVIDDYEEIDYAFNLFGIDDPACSFLGYSNDAEDDESIRIARLCISKGKTMRQIMRNEVLMNDICKVQNRILAGVDKVYFGTEAVYQLYTRALWGDVFEEPKIPNYAVWCADTAKRILLQQSNYMFIHPIAVKDMTDRMASDVSYSVWYAWDMYKKIETIAIRIGSRKNMLAHAFYSGISKRGFEASKNIDEDFLMPLTGFCQVREDVSMHLLLGIRYVKVGALMFALTHDDCINLATMAQCYYRTALYFTQSNGYAPRTIEKATSLIKDIAAHCCRLIDAKKNFSHIIRSMHILSQGEFNDAFEETFGSDLGWKERSANYKREAKELDPMGIVFHNRAVALAVDTTDKLNTCFIYHAFVGDEMIIDDLRSKVAHMTEKVRTADKHEWSAFIRFVKSYTLCRFMMVNKKKPNCGGDIHLLNEKWAERCVTGMFTMPPQSDWGKVWIENEFKYSPFADTWHLDAQDVAYVVKDSEGIVNAKYMSDRKIHSELLMAMTHGNTLDILTGSTPYSARNRVCDGGEVKEVVVTTAPKAENAKPSWKKRVTFAADCEFRKLQAEVDRNCRRVMSFIRGPSLGVDQCILEKQFADICDATATGLEGAICSHDISAWSESMDRDRKFEFEEVLINMFDRPKMINIKADWAKINGVVAKQACKDVVKIDNGSFQGFDGSASTILHSMILIYCLDSARRAGIIPTTVKTNMATLIDDCIALMVDLNKKDEAVNFWAHLKVTYLKLGFEIDDLKSIFSTIKAIYLSRRFMLGGEVPADLKVFLKAHSSYEDPLRCSLDIPNDIFGAMRGACDANGEALFIYLSACISTLAELAHSNPLIVQIPPSAAAIFALAPFTENGWGFPSVISWATNDVTDKRSHFNAILESSAVHACQSPDFTLNIDVHPKPVAKAIYAIKSQPWRMVSYSNIFTNPFEAIREGPLKPDMLRRNAVQDILAEVATSEPWKSLLKWNSSSTTVRVRELLVQSGALHAPTLAALVNCMPDNYRLSLVGKAIGSESLLSLVKNAARVILKRRIAKCASSYFAYAKALYQSTNVEYSAGDYAALTYIERTKIEREEFYTANGVNMTDHTFPDPVATFTVAGRITGSVISPNAGSLRVWDKTRRAAFRTSQLISDKGMYVPRKSGRVWEVTCEYAKGWDTISQRVAMGLAVLARAEADGHRVEGLLTYFIKSWNELSNISPRDTHLIAIHGSIKRLDANPGSSTHPVIINRNILRGFNNKLKSALDAIPIECKAMGDNTSHLHDFLAHETAMVAVTAVIFGTLQYLGRCDYTLSYNMAARQGCIVAESAVRMSTNTVNEMINLEIADGADNYGLLQACPELIAEIAIPTMRSSWVMMINALIDRDTSAVESLRRDAASATIAELTESLLEEEAFYSPSVIIAADPAARKSVVTSASERLALVPTQESARVVGDAYTLGVKTIGSKFARALSAHQPEHILAATAVRSLVWSRIKTTSPVQLAKILYQDPDADYSLISRCGSVDFWRGAVIEIAKCAGKKPLSEMIMAAFRSLGVHELHVKHTNDIKDATQSIASYFGAHLRNVVILVSDLVSSLAGRSSADYSKPLIERIITNNPSVMNAKYRKEHMLGLINSNIVNYKDRIQKLEDGEPAHRGDKRIPKEERYPRIVELRCRLYAYMAVDVADTGEATLNEMKFADIISNSARRVFERVKIDTNLLPASAINFEGALDYMVAVKSIINRFPKITNDGWDPPSGQIGARMAYEIISMDTKMVMNTKFAVSASEIAPRIHKRVIITPHEVPHVPEPVTDMSTFCFDDDDDDDIDLMALDDATAAACMLSAGKPLSIPYWHALYALLIAGVYHSATVNEKLGTGLPDDITPTAIREAHLEDFTDDEISNAFKSIATDYVSNGILFDPEWLNRDEADAYTVDEASHIRGGFLF